MTEQELQELEKLCELSPRGFNEINSLVLAVPELIKEVRRLKEKVVSREMRIEFLESQLDQKTELLSVAVEALEFYAKNFTGEYHPDIGEKARKTLSQIKSVSDRETEGI